MAVWVLLFGCTAVAGKPTKRPAVDEQAMHEAMSSSLGEEDEFSSSASYAHYLRSRMAHHEGDHRKALDELRLALASDDDNPFLVTALAEEYARLADLDRAERELRRVIERHPDYHPAQLLMGRVLFEAQRFTRAKVHLARAIKLRPKDPDAYLVLTQLWLELGNPDQAVQVVDDLAVAIPGEPIGQKRLGIALAERNDLPRAEKLLKRAAEKDPGDFETWVTLAQLFETAQRPADAEEAYSHALEADPENKEVLLSAGRLALRLGSTVRARAYFGQLLSVSADPELVVKVAFSYLATRQLTEAAEVLETARSSGLGEPRLSFYAGLVHEKLGRHARAAEAYGQVPSDSDLFHEARLHQGTCLSMAGQHRAALELLRKAISEKPDYVALYPANARALERAGLRQEAETFLMHSLKDQPSPELFEALATLYEHTGKLTDAISLLSNALVGKPKDEMLLYTLGEAYERKGEHLKSMEKMRAVLDVNPENALAMNFIGYSLAQKGGDYDEAEKLLNKAISLKPESGAFLDSLGWLYFRRGEYQRSVETLERAVNLTPGEPTIFEHLGDAYQRLAKREKAADAYRNALEALRSSPDLAEGKGQRAGLEKKLKALSTETADR